MIKICLAGNPNCGKTTLFNELTGSTAHVGNWPGVTVEKREGIYKKGKENISVVDLPGIYSLSPYTDEEIITRNYILNEHPDIIVNVIDATNLERNLYLSTQLLELNIPIIIALNMYDLIEKNNESINIKLLEEKLNVPVIPISAQKGSNLDCLMDKVKKSDEKKYYGKTIISNPKLLEIIDHVNKIYESKSISNSLFHTIKLIEEDDIEIKDNADIYNNFLDLKDNFKDEIFGDDLCAMIADDRYKNISEKLTIAKSSTNKNRITSSDKADKILTNRFLGIPIFLMILFLIFHLTFSDNLFFLGGLFNENTKVCFEGSIFEGLFWTENGINSLGVILQNFIVSITDIISSFVNDGLGNYLEGLVANGASSRIMWINGFICDGVLGGLFAVLSFLPKILLLFLFFSILEDSGYMSRVAFILDRIFRKFGLSGKAFMPMIMGFGCSVPAMINTRILGDEKEKTTTIRVIPFFSCGAKLPILTAIAAGIVSFFGVGNADIITYSMYLVGMTTAIISVIIMRQTVMKGDVSPFIMELPKYHMPQSKALMLHLWDKLKHFINKAFTIILASTIIIWIISHFSFNWEFLQDEEINRSILAGIGQLLTPLFTPLGFGMQLNKFGWVFVVAAITGLIAKENVIATFGTLAACIIGASIDMAGDGADVTSVVTMIEATGITIPGLLAFITCNMTTIPCFAAVATAKAELPKNKFKSTLLFWLGTSYLISTMIYVIGTWWWTSFIFLLFFIIAYSFIKSRQNRKKG